MYYVTTTIFLEQCLGFVYCGMSIKQSIKKGMSKNVSGH